MATWFAQNSSVNIDSANQWNSAANGSGSWLTWASLAASDVLVANGKTSIAINVDFTCATICNDGTGGATNGGNFTVATGRAITSSIVGGNNICVTVSSSSTVTLVGNISNGSGGTGVVVHSGSGNLEITGNISAGGVSGLYYTGSGSITIVGNITAGTGTSARGVHLAGAPPSFNVTGNVTGATAEGVYGYTTSMGFSGVATASGTRPALYIRSGTITLASGTQFVDAANGVQAFTSDAFPSIRIPDSGTFAETKASVSAGMRTLTTAGANQAATTDVRSGVSYGGGTGSLIVPSPSYVASGVPTDNTVGSYTGGGLDAAGVRSAIGLASANLDTQLSTIDDFLDTEVAAIKIKTDQLAFTSGKVNAELDSDSRAAILTQQLIESYAADGAAPTVAQALMMLLQHHQQKSVTGTTVTIKKLDKSTTAGTYTLDSATDPTSITRAT
jgi:hypothetical protein